MEPYSHFFPDEALSAGDGQKRISGEKDARRKDSQEKRMADSASLNTHIQDCSYSVNVQ